MQAIEFGTGEKICMARFRDDLSRILKGQRGSAQRPSAPSMRQNDSTIFRRTQRHQEPSLSRRPWFVFNRDRRGTKMRTNLRRIVIGATLAGAGVLILRGLKPKLDERFRTACGRMFERMPDDFPPKRMMQSIEQIRQKTARILELLEERKPAAGGPSGSAPPPLT
jgi:hypothetical protein